jgi:type IV secretory pathway TrbL component
VVTIGVYYYLITHLPYLTDAALQTFVQWGLAPTGAFTLGDFLLPSRIIRAGWTAAYPVGQLMMMMKGKVAPWNWPTLAIYLFTWLAIIGSFAVLAYEAIAALLNYHLAVMASPVLFPWGVLRHTGFLAELSVAWIVAGLIQVFLMAGIMGISVGLFEMASQLPNPAADRDPGISEAMVMAIIATFFAGLAWTVPKRAASLGGRGMALALTGSDVYLPLWRAAAPAIRGTSAMLSARAQQTNTAGQTQAQGRP